MAESDWDAHKTEEGQTFYHNRITGETSWDYPGSDKAGRALSSRNAWVAVWSEEQQRYYYHNQATGTTQWEHPGAVQPAAPDPCPPTYSAVLGDHAEHDTNEHASGRSPRQGQQASLAIRGRGEGALEHHAMDNGQGSTAHEAGAGLGERTLDVTADYVSPPAVYPKAAVKVQSPPARVLTASPPAEREGATLRKALNRRQESLQRLEATREAARARIAALKAETEARRASRLAAKAARKTAATDVREAARARREEASNAGTPARTSGVPESIESGTRAVVGKRALLCDTAGTDVAQGSLGWREAYGTAEAVSTSCNSGVFNKDVLQGEQETGRRGRATAPGILATPPESEKGARAFRGVGAETLQPHDSRTEGPNLTQSPEVIGLGKMGVPAMESGHLPAGNNEAEDFSASTNSARGCRHAKSSDVTHGASIRSRSPLVASPPSPPPYDLVCQIPDDCGVEHGMSAVEAIGVEARTPANGEYSNGNRGKLNAGFSGLGVGEEHEREDDAVVRKGFEEVALLSAKADAEISAILGNPRSYGSASSEDSTSKFGKISGTTAEQQSIAHEVLESCSGLQAQGDDEVPERRNLENCAALVEGAVWRVGRLLELMGSVGESEAWADRVSEDQYRACRRLVEFGSAGVVLLTYEDDLARCGPGEAYDLVRRQGRKLCYSAFGCLALSGRVSPGMWAAMARSGPGFVPERAHRPLDAVTSTADCTSLERLLDVCVHVVSVGTEAVTEKTGLDERAYFYGKEEAKEFDGEEDEGGELMGMALALICEALRACCKREVESLRRWKGMSRLVIVLMDTIVRGLEGSYMMATRALLGSNHPFLRSPLRGGTDGEEAALPPSMVIDALCSHLARHEVQGAVLHVLNEEGYPNGDPEVASLCLSFCSEAFEAENSRGLFYVNDVKVMVDIIIRELCNLPADDTLRADYLHLLQRLLNRSEWASRGYRYREAEIKHASGIATDWVPS